MTNTELSNIRDEKKLSKSDFAKLLGIAPSLLGRYEKGSRAIPDSIAEKIQSLSDMAAAAEIEVKKNTRKATREVKEAFEGAVETVRGAVDDKASEKSDDAVADEIEMKKSARKAARDTKTAVEDTVAAVKEAMEDQAAATEIEIKKTARKTVRKAGEAADMASAAVKETVRKAAGLPNIVIQSPMGGYITADDIVKKVPKNTTDVYVKVDENKLYYVLDNGEAGDVDIWD